jgi:putative flippase GtrA
MALVTLVRALHERFRQLINEAAKFGVVGAIAFVITTVGTNLLHFQAGLGPLKSPIIATIVATIVAYAGNRYWTFRNREGSSMGREFLVFLVLNGVGLGIQLAIIGFTYYVLGLQDKLSYNVALILGIGLGTLFRFWSYRRFVWLAPDAGQAGDGAVPPPANPPMRPAHVAAWDRPPNQGAPGQAPDLLPTNGHANGHTNRQAGRDWTSTGQSSQG